VIKKNNIQKKRGMGYLNERTQLAKGMIAGQNEQRKT